MRASAVCFAVLFAPLQGCATSVHVPKITNIEFAPSDANGMLVLAQNGGTAYAPGRYRFVRIGRELQHALEPVDIEVGGRGQVLIGRRSGAVEATHVFHYAVVPPGDYVLAYLDSAANNTVTLTSRWRCFANEASIYSVSAGNIAVVRVPDRISYDLYRDNGIVRNALLGRMPPGTTLDDLSSNEKAEQDFAEIKATNLLLTAPFQIASPVGAITFEGSPGTELDECLPSGMAIALVQ